MRMGPISSNHFHGFHSADFLESAGRFKWLAFWAITVQNSPEPKILLSADFFNPTGRFGSVMQTGSEPLSETELSSSFSAAPFLVSAPRCWASDLASIEPEIGTTSCCLNLRSAGGPLGLAMKAGNLFILPSLGAFFYRLWYSCSRRILSALAGS